MSEDLKGMRLRPRNFDKKEDDDDIGHTLGSEAMITFL